METTNLACGAWKLIESGIMQYIDEPGCRPAALVVHPKHVPALRREMPDATALLDGVNVIVSPMFDLPTLVDGQGNNHEL